MEKIEYTYNELNDEAVRFFFNGLDLVSMGGPEKTEKPGIFWSPAMNSDGNGYDLYWAHSGNFGDLDFYTLQEAEIAELD